MFKQSKFWPYNIKENKTTMKEHPPSGSKLTAEQWYHEDSTSNHQNQCQICRKSTPNCQNEQSILIKYI